MTENDVDITRRRFLTGTATVIGGVGAAAAAIPFISSFQPSAKTKAIGAPIEVDISKLELGQRFIRKWRGQPVWIIRRTPAMIEELKNPPSDILSDPDSKQSKQPVYAANAWRSQKPDYLIMVGLCTHLGCSPTFVPDANSAGMGEGWTGGFYCPCHGSKFDLAGRVFAAMPAPTNMIVPPYRFLSDTLVVIGEDDGGAA